MRVDPFLARDRTGEPIGWCKKRGPVQVRFNGFPKLRRTLFYNAIEEMFGHAGITTVLGEDETYTPESIGCPDAPTFQTVLVIALATDNPIWKQGYIAQADAWAVNTGFYQTPNGLSERNGGCILAHADVPRMYIRTIALHEAGHLLGLAHRPGAGTSVMNTYPDVDKPSKTDIANLKILGKQCRE